MVSALLCFALFSQTPPPLTLIDWKLQPGVGSRLANQIGGRDPGDKEVVGRVRNDSGEPLKDGILVKVVWLGKDDEVVGTDTDAVVAQELEQGDTATFTAPATPPKDAVDYKLEFKTVLQKPLKYKVLDKSKGKAKKSPRQ